MAAGRPVVSNGTGDIKELFERHHIGLMAAENPEDMAQKVFEILSNDQLATQLGKNSRKAAEKYFDWRILSKKLLEDFV